MVCSHVVKLFTLTLQGVSGRSGTNRCMIVVWTGGEKVSDEDPETPPDLCSDGWPFCKDESSLFP